MITLNNEYFDELNRYKKKYIEVSEENQPLGQSKRIEVTDEFYVFFKKFYENKYKVIHKVDIELEKMVSVEEKYYKEELKQYKIKHKVKGF